MTENYWDPLSEHSEDEGIIAAAKKRQIKNILKSYVSAYDPFSELIQNSMDAIDMRQSKITEENYQGKIFILINLKENSLSVTDNGVGFNSSEFKSFLAPNISFKDGAKTRGNKGVGSTYIAFGFNFLQLGTKSPGYEYIAELENGRSWVEDMAGIVTKPQVKPSKLLHKVFDEIERGSTFTIKLGGDFTRPKTLTYFKAESAEQWLNILLVKTPLGNIDFFGTNKNKTFFNLTVIDTEGNETTVDSATADYIYPHHNISASKNLKDLIAFQTKSVLEGKPADKFPAEFERLNGLYEFFNSEELKKLRSKKLDKDNLELIDKYQMSAYGFFCYSTDIWDELSDKVFKLRKGTRLMRGGLQLANNYMSQGELIAIPLTSDIGYQNQTFVLLHFLNADPDLGRKGFQPELKELGEALSVAIVNRFKKWRERLREDSGAKPDISDSDDVFAWLNEQVTYEKTNPLIITNKNFFAPVKEISITSIPQSEQDTIVLFNQLLAGGVIRGLKLLATNQQKQYDGVFKFTIREPLDNNIYHSDTNPLGVDKLEQKAEYTSRPFILEYKYSLDGLIREFENGVKKENEIHLLIAWQTGDLWKKKYEAVSLLDSSNIHHRKFHGLTHIFKSGSLTLNAIILSELIEFLNNPKEAEKSQKEKYGTDSDI